MDITITHFTATWLIPLVIFIIIAIISWIGIGLTKEMAGLPFAALFILDCAWFIIYMIVWFILHFKDLGLIHIKIV